VLLLLSSLPSGCVGGASAFADWAVLML